MAGVATRDAYGQELVELGRQFPEIVVLDADLSKSTKTADFARAYPDRFFNIGIAEQNMVGIAAGLATTGKVVFASSFAVFAAGRAFEVVRNSVCYPALNVKIAATHAGVTVGEDGGSHQAIEDIALMRVLPNMRVVVPSDGISTRILVAQAYEQPGPVYLRLGRSKVEDIYDGNRVFDPSRANVLREGNEVTLVACGLMVNAALKAADQLALDGIRATVLDMHTIKPLDENTLLHWAKITGAVVTAEEHSVIGGLGGAVAEYLGRSYPTPVIPVGVADLFGQSGTPDELLKYYGLTSEHIRAAAQQAIALKGTK
ncbi:MAG: transketolase family protein [Methylocystaceae bacterium]